MKYCLSLLLIFFASIASAFAGVTISSPTKGDYVNSPFYLSAYATSCSSQPVNSMGYSLDNSTTTTWAHGSSSIAGNVSASDGTHTVHVKAWGNQGAVCVTDVAITVTNAADQAATASASTSSSSVSISTPSSGENVSSPFSLSAYASSCSSHSISSMGYSIDSGDTTTMHGSTSIDTKVSASAGTHTVHVKAWADNGAVCTAQVGIKVTTVTDNVTANTSVVPSSAVSVSNLDSMGGWRATHDSGANGSASGSMSMVSSPSHSGSARKFSTSYKNSGAERYSIAFGDNRTATNFMYDAWVYLTSSLTNVANLEMDLNQTMTNGQTVIFGIQCDTPSGTWDYTENLGTASNPKGHWAHSSAPCSLKSWGAYKWHHVQMEYSRTSTGHITYKYVWLDGHQYTLNHTVFGARSMGWGSSLVINFQVDGRGTSGSSTVYLDNLTLYRW